MAPKAPAVHCSHTEMVAIGDLRPNPRNPNRHSAEQLSLLAKIIKGSGWRAPITVSKRSGLIVRGHGRLLAAQKLGLKVAPVDYQQYATDAEEWADLLADNRISELAEMDRGMLKDLLGEVDTGEIDMELTGFSPGELELLMTAAPPDGAKPPATGGGRSLPVTCPECGHEFEA